MVKIAIEKGEGNKQKLDLASILRRLGEYPAQNTSAANMNSWYPVAFRVTTFYLRRTHLSKKIANDTRAGISSPIRMHQYYSHVRGRMKSSWWEKYRTCPSRSMWRYARAIVRPLFRFFIASDQNWIMQWTRAGGSGSASRSKSSEHHLSVHMEERYTHMYIYRRQTRTYIKCPGIQGIYQRSGDLFPTRISERYDAYSSRTMQRLLDASKISTSAGCAN